jgi:hypothetical protein
VENIIIKFVADTSGLEPAIKQLQLLGKITDEDAAKFNAINQEQKEFIQNVNKSATEFGKLSNEVEDLAKTMQGGALDNFADNLKEVTEETKKAGNNFKSLKAELRELKAQIASGTLGEKELREATKRAAELTDELGDVNDKVKALASDTKRIDAVVTAFKGVAAAASVAAGATALFGTENKKMAEAAQKAQAAMALLAGVQELANIATTEGALRTMALDAAHKVTAVSARVMGTSIAGATAMATAGVSVLVAGIVALVTYLNDTEDEVEAFNKTIANIGKDEGSIENAKARIELIRKGLTEEAKLRLDAINERNKVQLQFEKEFRKDVKALDDAFNALSVEDRIRVNSKYQAERKKLEQKVKEDFILAEKVYNQTIEEINKAVADAKLKKEKEVSDKVIENKKNETRELIREEERRLREEIAANQIALQSATTIDQQAFYFKKITELKKDQVRLTSDLTDSELILKLEQLDSEYEAFVKMLVDKKYAQDKYYDDDLEAWAANEQAKLDAAKAAADKKKAEDDKKLLEEKARQKELAAFIIDQARVISDTLFTIGQQNRQATFDAEIEQLNRLRENELANKNLTEAQRAQIEKRYAQEEAKLKRQAWEQQKAADLAQAIINTALAVSRAWTIGPPQSIPASIAAGIAGAAQIAIIANTKPPKFADGTEFLVGAGTGRSDNNLAYLSHGERVVPAAVNSDYFPALSAIHNREVEPTFANNILTALANGTFELAAQYQSAQGSSKKSLDYDKLGKVLERNKSNVNINIDENGFNKYVEKMHSRTEFRNSKMRIKV